MRFFAIKGDYKTVEEVSSRLSPKGKVAVVSGNQKELAISFDNIKISLPPDIDRANELLSFLGADYVIYHLEDGLKNIPYLDPEDPDFDKKVEDLEEFETLPSLIRKIKSNEEINRAGAIVTFSGIVRGIEQGKRVLHLEFDSYDEIVRDKLREIENELRNSHGIVDVRIYHRTGKIKAGDDIVHVVVAGGHRQDVWPVIINSMELVKKLVPIWKKEVLEDGERWVDGEQ
jgi:molybdopterin synthase catalytic subunit